MHIKQKQSLTFSNGLQIFLIKLKELKQTD